ncbi:MAG: hypothetical protein WBG82_11610 [Parvibaculum sp.]|uniref:hypothetical protein n=1 Tax=Parvibaculum sp. TaxID=2024848 RepID=UPI003C7963D3
MPGYCFVIQPFDGGMFDRRYEEAFAPAIVAAGLEPYRVDQDPSASIPIEQIEARIPGAVACLADITLDSPNVWFELGYALSAGKEICLVCSTARSGKYPFDVQHRNIIKYQSDSPSDFDDLKSKISDRLMAIQDTANKLAAIKTRSPLKDDGGLSPHEIMVLASIMESRSGPEEGVSHWTVQQALDRQGYNNLGLNIGIERLLRKGLITSAKEANFDSDPCTVYFVEDAGSTWLLENVDMLDLRATPKRRSKKPDFPSNLDEEIPF